MSPRRANDSDRFPETNSGVLAEAAQGNWDNFLSAYLRPLFAEAAIQCRRYGFSVSDAEEMQQELITRLMAPRQVEALLAENQGRNVPARFLGQRQQGAVTVQFHTWLKAIIRNVVYEFVRSRKRRRAAPLWEIAPEELMKLESSLTAILDRQWLKDTLFRAACELQRESATARTKGARRLFALLVRTSILREPAQDIATSLGVDRTTVSGLIARSRARFVELACQAARIDDSSELRAQIERAPEVLVEAIRGAAMSVKFPGVA